MNIQYRSNGQRLMTDEEKLVVLQMVEDGWTRTEIAEHLGIKRNTVSSTLDTLRKADAQYNLGKNDAVKPENRDVRSLVIT